MTKEVYGPFKPRKHTNECRLCHRDCMIIGFGYCAACYKRTRKPDYDPSTDARYILRLLSPGRRPTLNPEELRNNRFEAQKRYKDGLKGFSVTRQSKGRKAAPTVVREPKVQWIGRLNMGLRLSARKK